MELIDAYLNGLKAKLRQIRADGFETTLEEDNIEEILANLERLPGASADDLARLKAAYPDCPDALLVLLRAIDGTYGREWQGEKIWLLILGSDLFEYPYHLLSTAQILAGVAKQTSIRNIYTVHLEEIEFDPRIDPDLPIGQRLHFSDCMNNGGSSQLFVDFNPREDGKVGQIVRFVHDPDGYQVIADSFADYLQWLMNNEYEFISE
ncbi:MAG: SMI1/KNR4 family protein, partial [Zoogloeaceae bacterium]|nr:SMI1/KNR4 family protein [Zoogloeaceae bacterium]